jgi:GST-like protein
MIKFYSWPTPNGQKVAIMLEEISLPYEAIPVNITKGEQFNPEFLKISPNNKIPAIVDEEGPDGKPIAVFESGAILIYLAEKTGSFLPKDVRSKTIVLEWLMFQMASVGPMFGQAGHFKNYAPEPIPYAIERYTNEVKRLLGVMDKRLQEVPYLGVDYSIADMATFPWVKAATSPYLEFNVEVYPHVQRWLTTLENRQAVQKGLSVLAEYRVQQPMDDEAKKNLFGPASQKR